MADREGAKTVAEWLIYWHFLLVTTGSDATPDVTWTGLRRRYW
jgi:hypothetical protein